MFHSPSMHLRCAAALRTVSRWAPAILATGLLLTSATAQETATETTPATALPADRQQGAATVKVEDCKIWLGKLASEEFGGRGTGQPGYGLAADYVSAHFKSLGLEARGEDGTYFQNVPWEQTKISKTEMTFSMDGKTVLTVAPDRMSGNVSADTKASGSVVLLNIEIPATKQRRMPRIEGLDELDLEGKVVVAIVRLNGNSKRMASFVMRRAMQGQGAAALISGTLDEVSGGLTGSSRQARRGGNPAAAGRNRSPLDVTIGGDDIRKLFGFANLTAETIADAPMVTELDLSANILVETEVGQAPAMNVWGVLPGSDPKLKDEYVVIGSHLDHLGRNATGFFPGADDDGSGTTGVMAVAQMFAKNEVRPKRSILFVCFSGEERGLVGSSYFVKNCPIPLSSIAAELQMDMIGRSEEESRDGGRLVNKGETAEDNKNVIHLVGTQKLSNTLHDICMAKNDTAGFDIEFDSEGLFTRSDHANFAYQGVPIAFVFTGIHKDYHQRTDTPDKIEYPKLLRIARYIYDVGFEVANRSDRPTVDMDLWKSFKKSDRRGRMPNEPVAPVTGGK
jgi:Zn-dependent M28 family amino/carboxypeptidase